MKQNKKTMEKTNKELVLWKDKNLDKTLATLTKGRKRGLKIKNERWDITTDTTQIQRIMRPLLTIKCGKTGQSRRNG